MRNLRPNQLIYFFIWLSILCVGCNNNQINISNISTDLSAYPNPLKQTKWVVTNNKIVGLNLMDTLFLLTKKYDTVQIWNYYAIEFTDNVHFNSYDSWECGNDCFTETFGHYKFVKEFEIELYTDSITRRGICNSATEFTDKLPKQIFIIQKDKNELKFTKTN